MHGRKREEYKAMQKDPKVASKLAQKAQQWHAITQDLRQRRRNGDHSPVTLALIEKLLMLHPDPLTLWNQRREILLHKDNNDDWPLEKELHLTQAALESNPKAYGAWFHRKWCLQEKINRKQQQQDELKTVLQSELQLTELFLKSDERNFHGWNYRRFVVGCLLHCCSSTATKITSTTSTTDEISKAWLADGSWGETTTLLAAFSSSSSSDPPPPQTPDSSGQFMGAQVAVRKLSVPATTANNTVASSSTSTLDETPTLDMELLQGEWQFTMNKIQDNFSNFSAFHYRSKLLPMMLIATLGSHPSDPTQILHDELGLVENAIFTEPDDQTAWWYHRFLLDFAASMLSFLQKSNSDNQHAGAAAAAAWKERLLEHVEMLRELSTEQSYSKWVWLGLVQVLERLQLDRDGSDNVQERRDIWSKLMQVDPDRKERYREMLLDLSG